MAKLALMTKKIEGVLDKMRVRLDFSMAHYELPIGKTYIALNGLLNYDISLYWDNTIYCKNCSTLTKKSYAQGYCYPCSQNLARCDLCILLPERCHYHLGTCREPRWGEENCFAPHIIYLANSSELKVGITRFNNIPERFIDQGAVTALPILKVDSRLKSGKLESILKQFISDKTNWRKMLKNEISPVDLRAQKQDLLARIKDDIDILEAEILEDKIIEINYPVLLYPKKITTLNFNKTAHISGKLLGIKGQYLLLDTGVLNIRKFSSYFIHFNT